MVLSRGTVNSSLVSPREIFVEALKYGAVSIALVHNHPSGDEAALESSDVLSLKSLLMSLKHSKSDLPDQSHFFLAFLYE